MQRNLELKKQGIKEFTYTELKKHEIINFIVNIHITERQLNQRTIMM